MDFYFGHQVPSASEQECLTLRVELYGRPTHRDTGQLVLHHTLPSILTSTPANMRLTFSTDDHKNTDVHDERGYIYYTISTPFGWNRLTTITKYNWINPSNRIPEALGTIEWHSWSETMIRFNGRQVSADTMLERHAWSSGRTFLGPDRRVYKWKLETTHCWMKPADVNMELVWYHRKNHGIMKPAHPAYLDVNDRVVSMMDHIILTFIYVEHLRHARRKR